MAKNKARRTKPKKRRAGGRGKPPNAAQSSGPKSSKRKAPRKWMELLATITLVAGLWLPSLIVLPGIADEFRIPKLAASEALLLLSVLFLALSRTGFSQRERSRTLLWVTAPLFAVAVLSVVVGDHPYHGGIALWNFGLALIVMLAWGTRALRVERVLTWLVWPALVATGLMLAQRWGWWRPFDIDAAQSRLELTALIGNVGEAALFVSLPFAVCWVKAYRCLSKRQAWRGALWACSGLCLLLTMVLTETATAIAAAALGMMVLGLLLPMRMRTRSVLASVAVLAAVVVLLIPAGERFRIKGMNLVRGELADLTTGRTDGWSAAGHMFAQNPALGVGFGAYVAEFTLAKESQIKAGVTYFDKHVGKSTFSNAHSEAFEWAAETGGLGVLVLLGSLFLAGRALWWKYARLPDGSGADASNADEASEEVFEFQLRRALIGATVAVVTVGALTYFPFRSALLAYPLAILLAALLSGRESEGDLALVESENEESEPVVGQKVWLRPAVVALTLLLLASSMWISKLRIRSSARLLAAEAIAGSMAQQKRVYPTVLRQLMAPLEEAGKTTPWDERIPLAMGSSHFLLGEHEEAIEWYRKSVAIAPRPETLFNLGRTLLKLDRRDEAVEMFVRSVYLDPLRVLYLDEEVSDQVLNLTKADLPAGVLRRAKIQARSAADEP